MDSTRCKKKEKEREKINAAGKDTKTSKQKDAEMFHS